LFGEKKNKNKKNVLVDPPVVELGQGIGLAAEAERREAMVGYSHEPLTEKSCRAKGSDLRCHFKNTRETAFALRKMSLVKAKAYLNAVLQYKRAIPFRRYCNKAGRTAQAKNEKATNDQARWPMKSVQYILGVLKNAEANAEVKGLDIDKLYIYHIQVDRAQKLRRRTYRAHGRINPFMCSPSHVQVVLAEKQEPVSKEPEQTNPSGAPSRKPSKKAMARRIRSGISSSS
jgi:large subunit ribosomal protein L17e